MYDLLRKYAPAHAPIGPGSGTDIGGGSADTGGSFGSIADALANSNYDEKAGPEYKLDYDGEEDDDGQGDRRGARQDGQDGPQRPDPQQQDGDGDQDDLDRLLAGLDPDGSEAGFEEDGDEGQGDPAQPQVLTDDTQVRLPDGSTRRYGDIAREAAEMGNQRQQFAQERQSFETARGQVRQQYETMQGQMQVLAQIAQALMPQEPDIGMLATDQQSYHILRNAYEKQSGMISQIVSMFQQNQQQIEAEHAQRMGAFRTEQAQKLVQRDPRFADDKFWDQFQRDMFSIGPRVYGYTADELRDGMVDSRQFEVFRDAMEFQKIKAAMRARKGAAKHQQARQRGAEQPRNQQNGQYLPRNPQGRVVTGSGARGRGDPKAAARQAAQAAFDKNPTIANAVNLLD